MMRMYETQSGVDAADSAATCSRTWRPRGRRDTRHCGWSCDGRGWPCGVGVVAGGGGAAADTAATAAAVVVKEPVVRRDGAAGRGNGGVPTGRGGGQPREWYRGIPIRLTPWRLSRAATTRTTCRRACCRRLQLTSMFPNLVLQNFYIKTKNSLEDGKSKAPYGYVLPDAA
jgi:hypothetical protein